MCCTVCCRYDEAAAEPAGDSPWLEGIFEGTQAAIQQASRRLTDYTAAKASTLSISRKILPAPHPSHHMESFARVDASRKRREA